MIHQTLSTQPFPRTPFMRRQLTAGLAWLASHNAEPDYHHQPWIIAVTKTPVIKIAMFAFIVLGITLTGCTTSYHSNLPKGALLVGGGLDIRYNAPAAGTVILIERTSGRIVATKSLEGKGAEFHFAPNSSDNGDVIASMFSTVPVKEGELTLVPTNTFFQLYFVPEKGKQK
jgi:hypothetical protein